MSTPRLLRTLAVVDVVSGVAALVASPWLADQLDVGVTPVRVAAILLLVLGVETHLMAERPVMAKVRIVTEAVCAMVAVDLAVLGDPTSAGTALLVATALWCATVAVEVALVQRTRTLVAS